MYSDDFLALIGYIGLIIAMLAGIFLLVININVPPDHDAMCKKFYGKEYQFVSGGRGADLCVTVDGKVRYYDLIE